jgi:hypothetical protein
MLNVVVNHGTIQNKTDISNKLLKSSEKYFILNFIIRKLIIKHSKKEKLIS